MEFIADLHIHSHFSMATSKQLTPEYLDYWGRKKGIRVIGTGDFTHPGWLKELEGKTRPGGNGLLQLKPELRIWEPGEPRDENSLPWFLLTAEISNIYKKDDKMRKVHNVVLSPNFEAVRKMQEALQQRKFNITSDGRPILGLDSRDLLELVLDINPANYFIPAHIWTPWFSALGAKSGFDSIAEAYGDMAGEITAVETGLSSDPPMNWMVSSLDGYTLVANSDAHSPEKLGRNANRFDTELSYSAIVEAMRTGGPQHFKGTIDMFPQAGKYHYAGHRKCGVVMDPAEALKKDYQCPVCGKTLTMGVLDRVAQLSDRKDIMARPHRHPFQSVIPLKELLAQIHGVGEKTLRVRKEYHQVLARHGSELHFLLDEPVGEIRARSGDILAEAVQRMRQREIILQEGYDGNYGKIAVFAPNERKHFNNQQALFGAADLPRRKPHPLLRFDLAEYQSLVKFYKRPVEGPQEGQHAAGPQAAHGLNPMQQAAVQHKEGPALVLAGPGTGKTRVLTQRIVRLASQEGVPAKSILAVTFTQKAASEMRGRLRDDFANKAQAPAVLTFHGLGLEILKEHAPATGRTNGFWLVGNDTRNDILEHFLQGKQAVARTQKLIARVKQHQQGLEDFPEAEQDAFRGYNQRLKRANAFDLDDLPYQACALLNQQTDLLIQYRLKYQYILVDEYQDINPVQYHLLQLLAGNKRPNLFAIGDANQAIYGFRGADVAFIRRFQDDFPEAKVYTLAKSYRCPDTFIRASGNVLSLPDLGQNALHGLDEEVKLQLVAQATEKSEAEYIARTIEKMIGGLRFFSMDSKIAEGNEDFGLQSLSDIAILTRTKAQFAPLAKALEDHSIPYEAVGNNALLQQEEVRKIIRALQEQAHPEAFAALWGRAQDGNLSSQKNKKQNLTALLEAAARQHAPQFPAEHPAQFAQLLAWAEGFKKDLGSFLQQLSLGQETDLRQGGGRVSLMTLHASKGLEFKAVFIAGCEEGILPYRFFHKQEIDRDEERRLLYVGMTRAQRFLYLTHAEKRTLTGKTMRQVRSSFLNTIEKQYMKQQRQELKKKKDNGQQLDLFG